MWDCRCSRNGVGGAHGKRSQMISGRWKGDSHKNWRRWTDCQSVRRLPTCPTTEGKCTNSRRGFCRVSGAPGPCPVEAPDVMQYEGPECPQTSAAENCL